MSAPVPGRRTASLPGAPHTLYCRAVTFLAGLLVLWLTRSAGTPLPVGAVIAMGSFVAFLVVFPLPLLGSEVNFSHVVLVGGALLYGPAAAGWAGCLGALAGALVRSLFAPGLARYFAGGQAKVSLFVFSAPLAALGPVAWLPPLTGAAWGAWLIATFLYSLGYGALLLVETALRGRRDLAEVKQDLGAVILVVFLPAPFIVLAIIAYPLIRAGALVGLGGVPAIFAVLINEMLHTRRVLESRLAQLVDLHREKDRLAGQAELYTETQHHLREQSILYLVSAHLAGVLDPSTVMQTIGRALAAAIEGAQVGVYRCEGQNKYQLAEAPPGAPDLPESIWFSKTQSEGLAQPLLTPIDLVAHHGLGDWQRIPAHGRGWAFPMVANRQPLGLAILWAPAQAVLQITDLQLLQTIASQGAVTLQNARLFADLRQSHSRLSAVVNSVQEGLVMVNQAGEVALANEPARKLAGLSWEMLEGMRLSDLPPASLERMGYTPGEARQIDHLPLAARAALAVPDDTGLHHYERQALPVAAVENDPVGWLLVYRDVTEEVEIAQTRELLTETLVHDLRSPLGSILTALEFIQAKTDQLSGAENCQAPIQAAERSAQRLLGLVETLLEISALQSGKVAVSEDAIDLLALGQAVISENTLLADEYQVRLRCCIPPDLPRVQGDASKISRVLTNLVDNALKFSPGGEEVVLGAKSETPGWVTVQVSDRGSGVPKEYRTKIFDRFSQVPGQRGRRRGCGLGLAFCQLAVAAQGGQIWVEPHSGGGSVFNVTLRLWPEI